MDHTPLDIWLVIGRKYYRFLTHPIQGIYPSWKHDNRPIQFSELKESKVFAKQSTLSFAFWDNFFFNNTFLKMFKCVWICIKYKRTQMLCIEQVITIPITNLHFWFLKNVLESHYLLWNMKNYGLDLEFDRKHNFYFVTKTSKSL